MNTPFLRNYSPGKGVTQLGSAHSWLLGRERTDVLDYHDAAIFDFLVPKNKKKDGGPIESHPLDLVRRRRTARPPNMVAFLLSGGPTSRSASLFGCHSGALVPKLRRHSVGARV
ncbi:MAG: hypothetical protein EBZ48_08425 [Proteobacteria bacterium]|nr:hypothetical protein [Pseudomonadota bacterium]